eukprot:1577664-Pleurochrysis_carterae.AAC.1
MIGIPRSSKNLSPGGALTKTSPSSPSNLPCGYAASTSNCRTRRLAVHPTAHRSLKVAERAAGANVSS